MMRYEVESSEAGQARLDVFADRPARRCISRRLFGKFTEHLGRNVYNGMWAQILRNPGFEAEDKFHPSHLRRRLAGMERALGTAGLAAAPAQGIAPYWIGLGQDATYALDPKARNADHCQRITHTSDAGPAGIQQPIFLPLHRVAAYHLSFWARATAVRSIRISIDLNGVEVAKAEVRGPGEDWTRYAVKLNVNGPEKRPGTLFYLRIAFADKGTLWLDQMFLFPSDHVDGFDPDVVRLWREARLPLLRFPGGNFVSGYHWKDGIGPVDKRPTRPNPAWQVAEYNHVGTDEMMKFCKAIGCEPFICVNAGNGTAQEAANWVQYCNGSVKTPYGALRAKNGHPQPYNVRLWEVGNELYGEWQIGHCDAATYAERYAEFVRAMRAADPKIEFIANGHTPQWNAELMKRHPNLVRSISVHSLIGAAAPRDADPAAVFEALMGYTHAYPEILRRLAAPMRRAGIPPVLAITELQIFTKHHRLPTNSTLAEALWAASIINVGIRSLGAVELITHSALVNHGGCVCKQHEFVWPQPVYFTHRLYGTQSGVRPLHVKFTGPCFAAPSVKSLPRPRKVPLLDAVALTSEDGAELTLIVVNRSPRRKQRTRITLHDFASQPTVRIRTVTGSSFLTRNTFEHPDAVRLDERTTKLGRGSLPHDFPPHSLTALVFKRRGAGE